MSPKKKMKKMSPKKKKKIKMISSERNDCLSKGSMVEVNREVMIDGYSNINRVWYAATILESPPFSSTSDKKRYLVGYRNLRSNKSPLVEFVDSAFVRPTAPTETKDQPLQVNDDVDVFYLDGWWVGVIRQVLENSRYIVCVENLNELIEFRRSDLRLHWDWDDGINWVQPEKERICQREVGANSQIESRGRPSQSLIKGARASVGEECNGAIELELPTITGGESIGCTMKEAEMAIVETSRSTDYVENPISKRLEGMLFPKILQHSRFLPGRTVNQCNKVTGRLVEIPRQCVANEAASESVPAENHCLPYVAKEVTSDSVPDDNQCLRFLKRSPLWKSVESMEEFQKMPQNPHFHTLVECKEVCREGIAIAYMVTFAKLVKQISKLQINDPRSIFTNILKDLFELEKQGFDIKALQIHLIKLRKIKDREEQLQEKSKVVKTQIIERTCEKNKLKEEADDVFKKIKELREKEAMMVSVKDNNDYEISTLRSDVDVIYKDIQSSRLKFESVAAAPLGDSHGNYEYW